MYLTPAMILQDPAWALVIFFYSQEKRSYEKHGSTASRSEQVFWKLPERKVMWILMPSLVTSDGKEDGQRTCMDPAEA